MTESISQPKVSVVIPMYNAREWIAGALRSVLEQSFQDYEILVVDDGGADLGEEVVATFCDSRIRQFRQENRGLAGARNTGIRMALGEYIAFLDADDRWRHDKLARHVAFLDENLGIGVSFSWSEFIGEGDRSLGLMQKPRNRPFDAAHIFCRNPIGNGSAPVIRRSVFDQIEFLHPVGRYPCWFDESYRQSEDIECWTRIALTTSAGFGCIPAPLTLYRVNADGLSANTEVQLATWRRFRDKVASIDADFARRIAPRSEAYQLRYLARRAIFSGDGRRAVRFAFGALRYWPGILSEEPRKTLVTLAGAVAIAVMPRMVIEMLRGVLSTRAADPLPAIGESR